MSELVQDDSKLASALAERAPKGKKTYAVWCPEDGPCRLWHSTEADARRAAYRMAETHPGQSFHVVRFGHLACVPSDPQRADSTSAL